MKTIQLQQPPNQKNKFLRYVMLAALILAFIPSFSQTWTAVSSLAPHNNQGVMLLLSDGSVICKTSSGGGDGYGNTWDKLTPNASGSYTSGTWSSISPMADTRLYFSSQILKDGRVYVCGGEYGSGGYKGEVYNPATNSWSSTPAQTSFVSDANSEILEDGRVLQAIVWAPATTKIYNPATNTYTNGPTALGSNNETAWLKLPDNSILYVTVNSTQSQRYIPATNTWISDANCAVSLYDPYGSEMGGAWLLPDGRGFFVGATGHTAFYTPSGTTAPGTWTAGPDLPGGKAVPDGPGAMMVDGKLLLAVSPAPTAANHFPAPTTFYIFDYITNTYTSIVAPGGGASINAPCYTSSMLQLPNGQVLYCRFDVNQYWVFNPAGAPLASGKPTISTVTQISANTYRITGTRFNGISQGANYGDDWQMSTNYPVIRVVNGANVYYCKSYNWNSTGVRRTGADTAFFTTPPGLPNVTYNLFVTANGNPSNAFTFVPNLVASVDISIISGSNPGCDGTPITFLASPNNGGGSPTYQWRLNGINIAGATNQTYTTSTLTQGNTITCVMTASIVVTGSPATSNTITMTINDNNIVLTPVASPSSICAGATTNLSVTSNYCQPVYTTGAGSGDYIGRVQIVGTTLNNTTTNSASPFYTLYPASGATTASLTAGSTYSITLSPGTFGSSNYLAAWIDYNQDKSLNVNEKLGQVGPLGAYPASGTIVFTVPSSAKNGQVRLRVREIYNTTLLDPCKTATFGETEDYIITISGGGVPAAIVYNWSPTTSPLSGTPVVATPSFSQAYSVTVTDVNGCTTFAKAEVEVNSPNFAATATPATICTGGTSSLSATKALNNYCNPIATYGTSSNDYITLVNISGTTLNNATGASASPFYTLFPAAGSTTATLTAGGTYSLILSPGTYPAYNTIAAWIDFDHNSILNTGIEKLGETGYITAAPATSTITFKVPTWAKNGTTRLRVREVYAGSNIDPCTPYFYGETEDYVITITGGVNETPYTYAWLGGTIPATGSPVSASPLVSSNYTVTATDQYGCTSTDESAVIVNSPNFTVQAASPSVLCEGGITNLSVTPDDPTYCQPSYYTGTTDGDYVGYVKIPGTTLDNTTVGSVAPYYSLFPYFGNTTATLAVGTTYTLTLSAGTFSSGNNLAAWIDYDNNGIFLSALEKLGEAINAPVYPGTVSFVFTVPAYAKNGKVRLRVREVYSIQNINPCNPYSYGETEDYDITITGGVGADVYTWSPATVPVSGASVTATPTSSTAYTVTATDGYGCTKTGISSVVINSPAFLLNASPSTICEGASSILTAVADYCQPNSGNGTQFGDYINSVSIASTSLSNTTGANPSPYYTLYPASGSTTTTLTAGNTYTISVQTGTYSNNDVAVWIDYDHNSALSPGIEKLGEIDNIGSSATATFTFTVPAWAVNGATRLRVREADQVTIGGMESCNNTSYGEVEDYIITITGGVASSAPATYAWSTGATGNTVTVTPSYSQSYNVTATDANGCTKTSSLSVVVNTLPNISATATPSSICAGSISVLTASENPLPAICQPIYSSGTGFGDYCASVVIPGTTLTNTTTGSAAPFYTLYPTAGSTTATLFAGGTYTLTLGAGTYCCSNNFAAWIDYNGDNILTNGTEKLGELYAISGGTTGNIVFTIPAWAKNGTPRLRVREVYASSGLDACSSYAYGETEDYTITIAGGLTSVAPTYAWSPVTSPTTGAVVNATPTETTTYTVTATNQYGCSNTATTTVNQITLAAFTNNSTTIACGTPANVSFNASPLTCSGNAFNGNGTSFAATLANSYATTATSGITMEAWVKWNGSTGTNQFIYYNGNSGSNGYGIMLSSANANRISVICGGVAVLNSTVNLTVGTWQHIAVVRSLTIAPFIIGTWTLYVDGVAYALTLNTTTPLTPSSGGTFVGKGITSEWFKGAIDEVRVFNVARSAAQISADREACIAAPQANLVGYWQFNEASGTACADASGGGRTLALTNASARTVSASYAWNYGDATTGTGITSSHTYTTLGSKTVTLTVTDITGCAATNTQTIVINPCVTLLNLKCFIQSYYAGGGLMAPVLLNQGRPNLSTQADTIIVELHNSTSPYAMFDSYKGVLNTNGTITCSFSPGATGGNYYIVVKHRNGLQTWSANPVTMSASTNYDFSNLANKAYGSNQIQISTSPVIWAFYTGDLNGDENIDLLDQSSVETDINNFAFGYYPTDLNGDGNVDLLDSPDLEANINNFIFSLHP